MAKDWKPDTQSRALLAHMQAHVRMRNLTDNGAGGRISDLFDAVGYDMDSSTMYVIWHAGRRGATYAYLNVSARRYAWLIHTDHLRGGYTGATGTYFCERMRHNPRYVSIQIDYNR